jgi:hypothetical protein
VLSVCPSLGEVFTWLGAKFWLVEPWEQGIRETDRTGRIALHAAAGIPNEIGLVRRLTRTYPGAVPPRIYLCTALVSNRLPYFFSRSFPRANRTCRVAVPLYSSVQVPLNLFQNSNSRSVTHCARAQPFVVATFANYFRSIGSLLGVSKGGENAGTALLARAPL